MKRILLIAAMLLSATGLYADDSCMGTECLDKKIKNSCTVDTAIGCIDWEQGIVYAVGMGVPNDTVKSAAQKRYSAHQAARVVAQRNLLAMVKDIQIDSKQTVNMGMLTNDVINTQISGTIRQVSEVGQPKAMGDGSMVVTMKMHLKDIMGVLQKNDFFTQGMRPDSNKPSTQAKALAEPKKKKSIYGGDTTTFYSGVILDARGQGVQPAMSPKVYNTKGIEVYGSAKVERKFALEYGIAGYVKNMTKAMSNERIKGNPLIIKALKGGGTKSADLKISDADANLLKTLDKSQTFLREARVMILL